MDGNLQDTRGSILGTSTDGFRYICLCDYTFFPVFPWNEMIYWIEMWTREESYLDSVIL